MIIHVPFHFNPKTNLIQSIRFKISYFKIKSKLNSFSIYVNSTKVLYVDMQGWVTNRTYESYFNSIF